MKYALQKWILLGLLALLVLLSSGCWYCMRLAFVNAEGQGNFEALSDEKEPIFFLFMVKCTCAADDTGCLFGDIILKSAL